MNVLVVGRDPFGLDTGPTLYLRNVLSEMASYPQCAVTMLSLDRKATRRADRRDNVERYFLKEPRFLKTLLSPVLMRRDVCRIATEVRPDVIDLHYPERAELFSGLGVPLVVTIHGLVPEQLKHGLVPRHKRLLAPLYESKWWKGISLAQHAICLCQHDSAYLRARCSTPTSVIAVPRSMKYFVSKDVDADVVLSVGLLTPRKNQLALLRACAILKTALPGLRVRVIGGIESPGDRKYLLALRAFVAAADLGKHVTIIEGIDNERVIEEHKRAAVYVQTSSQETFPGAVVEALAAGTPAVVNDVPGLRETVIEGLTGFRVRTDDACLLAARIKELLEDRTKRERMGAAAREYASRTFLSSRVAKSRMTLFDHLCRPV